VWQAGDIVLERRLHDGRLRWVLPQRVVAADAERALLYVAAGSDYMRALTPDGAEHRGVDDGWALARRRWERTNVLVALQAGRAHALWVVWATTGEFRGWYVNLQDPPTIEDTGYRTFDHALDVVVDPDGSWHWKDEDEFLAAAQAGHIDPDAVRAEGERVLADPPWPTGYEDWRPPAGWGPLGLPRDWHVV
jgi:predicted RNA-binding protein associated with RNAse of E/G family